MRGYGGGKPALASTADAQIPIPAGLHRHRCPKMQRKNPLRLCCHSDMRCNRSKHHAAFSSSQLPGENMIPVITCAPAAVTKSTSRGRGQNCRTRSLAKKPVDWKFMCLRIKTVSGVIHEQHAGPPTHAGVSRNFFQVPGDMAERRILGRLSLNPVRRTNAVGPQGNRRSD